MLTLSIKGPKNRRHICENLIRWFVSKYISRYNVEIFVEHKNLLKDDILAYCDISKYETNQSNPRSFLIELDNKMNLELYTISVLHEMYHVLQFLRGDLKLKANKRYWKGKYIEDIPYEQQDHEIEAELKETELYQEYLDFVNT
jgi:hypothetical protein